uniref:Ig-like domain-containing protein n=1 Tax=Salmo trutta TaxID=8032 RepID=A0A674EIL3_SALTR
GLELTQPSSLDVKSGESLSITCKVSGYSLTDSTNLYGIGWIRQPVGKALEWIWTIYYDGSSRSQSSIKDRFSVTKYTSSNKLFLKGQNLQTEDTAVYYCARWPQ